MCDVDISITKLWGGVNSVDMPAKKLAKKSAKKSAAKKKLTPITVIVKRLAKEGKKGPSLMKAAGKEYRAQPGAPKKRKPSKRATKAKRVAKKK